MAHEAGSWMLIGSETAARSILGNRDHLGDAPVFWTREQRGEEAATWLFFGHKRRYLERMAPRTTGRHQRPGILRPRDGDCLLAGIRTRLLFLAIALMESFGIRTWVTNG
ncbi:hypothetical protein [Streptomyces sp. NPDC088261]|uniref:hypothetical protein n=1 Tax=Streptomyces sp. NPDC088261 TaxID=3365851 RepID=UPI00380EA570